MISGIALVSATLAAFPQPKSAFAEPYCPYMHFACPDDLYDCCCLKGVRCDLNAYQCEQWCGNG
jgi:hypothetical protein